MKQIKTIARDFPEDFDDQVNEALAEGWELVRRTYDKNFYIAMLEREIVTEAEKTCENCKHRDAHPEDEPCFSCSETCSEWEADV